ncbi:hypothetical protein [Antarctobacter sp.]|uniref:hypothetical protein n=1 Tax=Antarctobacter sp. TaxID=1872577 RepID=UPI003A8EE7BD
MPKDTNYTQPRPVPDAADHRAEARKRRDAANAASAGAVETTHNGEAEAFAGTWPTNFSKGLPHDPNGIVESTAYAAFFKEIADPTYLETGGKKSAPFDVPAYGGPYRTSSGFDNSDFMWRAWESPIAGHQFVLEGPDPAAVGIAPAPRLGSDELAAEMAEVYAMALLRDVSFEAIRGGSDDAQQVTEALGQMTWFDSDGTPKDADGGEISAVSAARRARDGGPLTRQTLFRGSSPGCAKGPYLSQFMLQGHDPLANGKSQLEGPQQIPGRAMMPDGSPITARDGMILFGAQRIDQRIEPQARQVDYLRDWAEWLDVQNGANTKNDQAFEPGGLTFISTPRDLATYVHFDALYQAYLNACLLMLSWGTAAGDGLPEPGGKNGSRDPFATWGGPHILTLVTETATRALRAVRRQKFQVHNRARPEKLASVASLCANGHGAVLGPAEAMAKAHLQKLETATRGGFSLMDAIAAAPTQPRFRHKAGSHDGLPDNSRNLLLPMAFPEGSPMHPAYGAGHATVAGACVTVLKAFFRTHAADGSAVSLREAGAPAVYVPAMDGKTLVTATHAGDDVDSLTLNGELNKLAANISIGRNMAGVHYFSDYFDSARMGERIAVGILAEQMTTYTESVTLSLETFDGDHLSIHGDGKGGTEIRPHGSTAKAWWTRHLPAQTGG